MDNDALADLRARLAANGKLTGPNQTSAAPHDDALADLRARLAARQSAPIQPHPAQSTEKTFADSPNGKHPGIWDTFTNGVAKGAAGLADSIPNALVNAANLGIAAYGVGKHVITGSTDFPSTIAPDALSGWSKIGHAAGLIDDNKNPTNMPERIADAVGQVVGGGGVNPRSLASSGARILEAPTSFSAYGPLARDIIAPIAAGTGMGVANEVTRGVDTGMPWLDTTIKTGASLAGGMLPGAVVAARGTAGDRAAAALSGITPEQIGQAKILAQRAAEQGSPITAYEALQHVTGANPKMQVQQRLAEQSDHAATTLTPIMQSRPANNAALMDQVTSGIARGSASPDTLAGTLQQAAQDSIDSARRSGNAAAEPYYAATSNDPAVRIPAHEWNALASDPRVAAALEAVKGDPYGGLHNATEGSAQWLDAAKKYLNSQSQAKSISGDAYGASNRSGAATAITDTMDQALPDYAKARDIVAQNMRDNVVPMQNGQIGKLANSNDFKQQSESLLPNAPADVTPDVVRNTATTIGAQNPDILSNFIAQDLSRKFAEASQRTMGGENAFGGAKFAANVAGNPAQEANLMEALRVSGGKPDLFSDALNTFRAQGYRPTAGSPTAQNLAEGAALKNFLSAPLQTAKAFSDAWTNGLALRGLTRALSSGGDSVDDVLALARQNGQLSPGQNNILGNIVAAPSVSGTTGPGDKDDGAKNSPPTVIGIINAARAKANSSTTP